MNTTTSHSARLMLRSVAIVAFAAIVVPCLSDAVQAHGIHGDQARTLKYGGLYEYFKVGAIHMLTGYDHLLFLFGVMFFLTTFKDIVTFITAFTIGHSITLIAATLYGWRDAGQQRGGGSCGAALV